MAVTVRPAHRNLQPYQPCGDFEQGQTPRRRRFESEAFDHAMERVIFVQRAMSSRTVAMRAGLKRAAQRWLLYHTLLRVGQAHGADSNLVGMRSCAFVFRRAAVHLHQD
jgi:hypothetical protein